ncbi:response regulator [Glycomyces dulcitolivorans]|jgi:two-component system response regulator DevR|uniref:response regulator n=1 Tax=Glycomyces dulcitolivorans TaxID=2200759 RepID=UPI000DD3FA04|nr:response regulator transcription factor [Glycomyces dulcitolivorans]
MDSELIGVFLLDGHEVVRRGLRELLEREDGIEVVGEAASAAEGVRRALAARPDVMVVDAQLPGGGVEACRRVRAADPSVGVLVLTSDEDDATLFAAIEAGAAGFLLKRVRGIDLVGAVRTVAAGGSLLDERMTGAVLGRLRSWSRRRTQDPPGRGAADD